MAAQEKKPDKVTQQQEQQTVIIHSFPITKCTLVLLHVHVRTAVTYARVFLVVDVDANGKRSNVLVEGDGERASLSPRLIT